MQAIPFTEIDCGHASAAPAVISLIIRGNDLAPGVSGFLGTILPKANIDKKVTVVLVWLEIWC